MVAAGEEPDNDAERAVSEASKPTPAANAGAPSGPSSDKRWEVRGTIVAAAITAIIGGIVTVAVTLINRPSGQHDSAINSPTSTPPATSSPRWPPAESVSITQVGVVNGDKGLTITGKVDVGNEGVIVFVGPRPDKSQYWAAQAEVKSDGSWTARIDTPPMPPDPYEVKAYRVRNEGIWRDPSENRYEEPEPCLGAQLFDPVCLDAQGSPVAVYSGKIESP